ncbi:S4 domain-containing protein YaaA [Lactobacillus sp. DCY120]|uniref:S4 domain-containing protein YaaA n=1 Tax=Bombilactobacillus apium TaxID=2675299 RepID=A0A850R7G0_9LACO|nr:S4 domain-containing protein YaaA [Bombilactobacillus apium]NVY96602.1 S4 domain-containing protein YaaA [Bombilactobacillus apium]
MEQTIQVHGEYLTLTQVLKEVGAIGTGGQAKWYLQDQTVQVNGARETRRGKKLRVGDQVLLADGTLVSLV